jgi:hypothetical protein
VQCLTERTARRERYTVWMPTNADTGRDVDNPGQVGEGVRAAVRERE